MFCADRVRVNRQTGKNGHRKGKWVVDLRSFRQLSDPSDELLPLILADQVELPWKDSQCIGRLPVGDV